MVFTVCHTIFLNLERMMNNGRSSNNRCHSIMWLYYCRAQQQQYNAAAQQAEVNAQIADQNADKLQAQAEEQSKSNTINEENKRRRMNAMLSQQRTNIGASGTAASGRAASALADSAYNRRQNLLLNVITQGKEWKIFFSNLPILLINVISIIKMHAITVKPASVHL